VKRVIGVAGVLMGVLVSTTTRADSDPSWLYDESYEADQEPSGHLFFDGRDVWTASWNRAERPIQEDWKIDFHFDPGFRRSVDGLRRSSQFASHLGAVSWTLGFLDGNSRANQILRRGAPSGANGTPAGDCGVATMALEVFPRMPMKPLHLAGLPDHPECGRRMVAMTEHHEGIDFYTCVDRAWPGHPDLTMITYVIEGGPLTWVYSPAPFATIPDYEDVDVMPMLPWAVPETCHPYFRRAPDANWEYARKNLAFNFAWDDAGELVWAQAWQDDTETGPFVVFYPDGMPQLIGARYDGQAHGVWYYLGSDGTLVEARLYGLGVELEQLPVETVQKVPGASP